MATEGFDLERRQELQAALSSLGAAVWAESGDDPAGGLGKPMRRFLMAAGYAPEVTRLVLAVLEKYGDPATAERAGVPPRDLVSLIDGAAHADTRRAAVPRALKAAGYPADLTRLVLTLLEKYGSDQPVEGAQVRDLVALLEGSGADAVKRTLEVAGYPAEVRKLVTALLGAPSGDLDAKDAVKRLLKLAGQPPAVTRSVLGVLDPPEAVPEEPPTLEELLRRAGHPPDVRRRVLAAIEPPEEVEVDAPTGIAKLLNKAGYPVEVRRRVLAALDPPAEVDTTTVITEALKRAGHPPDVRRRVLAAIDPPEEVQIDAPAAIAGVLRKAGYSAGDRRRVLAALAPSEPVEIDAPTGIAALLNKAGYPVEVRRRVLAAIDPPMEEERDVQESVRRLLRAGGYKADVVQLVASILERYDDPEAAESALKVSDLMPLVEVTPYDFDAREPVRRILRAAGYRVDLINFVVRLMELYTGSDVPVSGVRIRDLADLVEDTDEKLLSLLRHWRTAAPDDHLLGNELATVLGRRGVEPEVARDLAATIENDAGEGQLTELARVARFALSAEDACISMADPAWLDDPAFVKAYAEAKSISAWGRDIRWRVQTLAKAAAAARHVEGDFVECGVDTGGTARAVMAYLGDDVFHDRAFYLFDTFHGIVPEQLLADEPAPIEDRYPDVADVARANFADKPYVRIVEGTVPETLPSFAGTRVAFLHIDMNAAYPEVEAFKFFWTFLSPGAPVVFDDYGFPRHRAQRRALDEVAASLGVEIMMLPTCQGIVYKPPMGV